MLIAGKARQFPPFPSSKENTSKFFIQKVFFIGSIQEKEKLKNQALSMNSQSQSNSIEDIFDSSLNLEETHFKDGYSEGYSHGLTTGKEEAQQTGLKVGFEIGEELGFYRGCVDLWNSAIQVDLAQFSSRLKDSIKKMDELIEKYPVLDPEDESVQEIMDSLRLKFRIVRAGLGVKLEYDGHPKSKEVEF